MDMRQQWMQSRGWMIRLLGWKCGTKMNEMLRWRRRRHKGGGNGEQGNRNRNGERIVSLWAGLGLAWLWRGGGLGFCLRVRRRRASFPFFLHPPSPLSGPLESPSLFYSFLCSTCAATTPFYHSFPFPLILVPIWIPLCLVR